MTFYSLRVLNISSDCTLRCLLRYLLVKIDECISSTITLMNTKNNKGQRIDPCGTPALIKHQSDEAPGRTTRCIMF